MPARHRAVEAEGVADRDHRVADLDLGGVAERERVQLAGGVVDLEQGDVGGRVGADDFGLCSVSESPSWTSTSSAPSTTWALVRMWPSLSIRKPEPVAVPPLDSASPKGLKGERVLLRALVDFDEGDALAVALVDLVDGVASPLLSSLARSARRSAPAIVVESRRSWRRSSRPRSRSQPKTATTSAAEDGGAEGGREEISCRSWRAAVGALPQCFLNGAQNRF